MWGRGKTEEIAKTTAVIRNRYATVLGLDLEEHPDSSSPDGSLGREDHQPASKSKLQALAEPSPPASAVLAGASASFLHKTDPQPARHGAGPESLIPNALTPERLSQDSEERPPDPLTTFEQHANDYTSSLRRTLLLNGTTPAQDGSVSPGALQSTVEAALTYLTEKGDELLETQAKLFEKTVAQIANQHPSQAEERLRETVSRLEAYLAQADEMKLTMDENLANLAKHTTEAAQVQSKVLEENLTEITQQIGSRLQQELAPMASRLEDYRAQVDQMHATLETALTSFTLKTEEAAHQQARSFEEKIAHMSEEALSQTQDSLHSEITQLREAAAHSFEEQMTAVADRLYAERHDRMLAELQRTSEELGGQLGKQIEQRCEASLQQALQVLQDRLLAESTRLETSETPVTGNSAAPLPENIEVWSKRQLAVLEQRAGDLSTHLLDQVRAESQAIAQQLQDRLKTDTQFLETRIVDTLQGKLQTLTDEFRSLAERAFTRNEFDAELSRPTSE